jgi:hypothetical protein
MGGSSGREVSFNTSQPDRASFFVPSRPLDHYPEHDRLYDYG